MRRVAGRPYGDFDVAAFRRRMAAQWGVGEDQLAINVSVASNDDDLGAAESPNLAAFSTALNTSVVAISNLYRSFCVAPAPHLCRARVALGQCTPRPFGWHKKLPRDPRTIQ